MIDFLITPSGDLSFSESNKEKNRLEISFYKTTTSTLKIDFEVDTYQPTISKPNVLLVNFDIEQIKNNKRAMIVQEDSYKAQQILMRIKTSLGELYHRPEIGSKIETVMHKNLNDRTVISQVEEVIGNAIKDVIYNCSVKATPSIEKNNGYKQVINVMVYEDNNLIFVYEMEG